MTWKSYIFPQTIARFTSPYNKDIRIVEERGKYKILVSGSPQSGPYIEKLWMKALHVFGFPKNISPDSILVLGIAGGTVIHLLHSWYPNAKITAVDIDKTMIGIGKKYFSLNSMNNVVLKQADAKKYVQKKQTFDLIVVDLSFGRNIPPFVSSRKFLLDLQSRANGQIVINFLREKEYQNISENLKKTLTDLFLIVRQKPLYLNRFFMVK